MTDQTPDQILEEIVRSYHAAVGQALSQWSVIEQWLENLYASTVTIHPKAGRKSYWTIVAFSARLAMCHSALTVTFEKTDNLKLAEWKEIYRKLIDLNSKRNRLAHGHVIGNNIAKDGETTPRVRFHYNVSVDAWESIYNDVDFDPEDPNRTLSLEQIRAINNELVEVSLRIHRLNIPS